MQIAIPPPLSLRLEVGVSLRNLDELDSDGEILETIQGDFSRGMVSQGNTGTLEQIELFVYMTVQNYFIQQVQSVQLLVSLTGVAM